MLRSIDRQTVDLNAGSVDFYDYVDLEINVLYESA